MARSNKTFLTCVFIGGVLIACDAWALSCENYDASAFAALPSDENETLVPLCTVARAESLYDSGQSAYLAWRQENDDDTEFWDDWSGTSDSPVLSSNSDSTFYGLGVWMPAKYEDFDIMSIEDAQEWIKNHGVQMSFGIGGGDGHSPRVRLDYRWHDEKIDDVFLQVEIPFQ